VTDPEIPDDALDRRARRSNRLQLLLILLVVLLFGGGSMFALIYSLLQR
jgi:hypothetical protein